MKALLTIKKLTIRTEDTTIVKNFSLSVKPGELHVLMGPNGSGKSTIAYALMGHPAYTVRAQELSFAGKDLKRLPTDARARLGMFLAFQYPLTVSGLSLSHLLPAALGGNHKKHTASSDRYLTLADQMAAEQQTQQQTFHTASAEALAQLQLKQDMLYRNLNEGFSGGEKKKAEMFQMLMLKPKLAILDEPDSGLDIDALKIIAKTIHRAHQNGMAIILITHYQRILKFLKPHTIHVLRRGELIASGDSNLARMIERTGYDTLAE